MDRSELDRAHIFLAGFKDKNLSQCTLKSSKCVLTSIVILKINDNGVCSLNAQKKKNFKSKKSVRKYKCCMGKNLPRENQMNREGGSRIAHDFPTYLHVNCFIFQQMDGPFSFSLLFYSMSHVHKANKFQQNKPQK